MKRRLLAALAAFGLVATMTGLGSIPAMADELGDPTTSVEPTETPSTETLVTEPAVTEPAVTESSTDNPTGTPAGTPTKPIGPDPSLESDGAASKMSFSTESFEPFVYYGIIGALQPFTPANNQASAWVDAGEHDGAICYKYDSDDSDFSNNSHAYVTNDGKTVVLKPYGDDWPGDHWELLVVKASTWDAVNYHPIAGESYAAYDNKDISHYIVCKGDTPDEEEEPVYASAEVSTTDGTCFAEGTVVPGATVNATFGQPTYQSGQYTIVATATGDAVFPAGPGVSQDGKTKTFTGAIDPMQEEGCDKIDICHAKPPATAANGWNELSLPPAGILSGHADHAKDIIPAFGSYPGKNLTTVFVVNGEEVTGQQILDAGCNFDIRVPQKPAKSNEYCDDGYVQDGSITVYFGDLGDKIQYRITGPNTDILIENGDPTTVYLPAGAYTVTAEGVAPWEIDGKYEWEVTIKDAHCKVVVPDPEYGGEQCYDGETVDGYIWVDYSNGLDDKIRYRITGPDTNLVVDPNGSWTTDLPAGDYVVTVEPLAEWIVKGDTFPYQLTISSATNCQCYVPPQIDKQSLSILADIDPVCAEAEVSVTDPTCDAAGQLQLGETLLATWGEPVIENGHYTVVATADGGYRFEPGDGVSEDGFTKTFEGDLPAKLTNCGDLPTLALTGSDGGGILLWLAGLATVLGITGVVASYRRNPEWRSSSKR